MSEPVDKRSPCAESAPRPPGWPTERYATVVADPPWPMPESGRTTRGETDAKGVYTAKGGRQVDGTWWGRHRIGFGGAFTTTTEFVIFGRRGTLKAKQRTDSSWWSWSRVYVSGHIAHSAKPPAFLDVVESVSPGPYVELFARAPRLGWDSWGYGYEEVAS